MSFRADLNRVAGIGEQLEGMQQRVREGIRELRERGGTAPQPPNAPPIQGGATPPDPGRVPRLDPAVLGRIGAQLPPEDQANMLRAFNMDEYLQQLAAQGAPQAVINVIGNQAVIRAIEAGERGDTLIQTVARTAQQLGVDAHSVLNYLSPYLLAQAPPQVRAAAGNLRAMDFTLARAQAAMPENHPIRRHIITFRAGLNALAGGATLYGGYSMLSKAYEQIYEWLRYHEELPPVDAGRPDIRFIDDAPDTDSTITDISEAMEKFNAAVDASPNIPNPEQEAERLRDIIINHNNYGVQMPADILKVYQQRFEDAVLSALKKRLAYIRSQSVTRQYYTTAAMKRRAVLPVGNINTWALEEYPPRII